MDVLLHVGVDVHGGVNVGVRVRVQTIAITVLDVVKINAGIHNVSSFEALQGSMATLLQQLLDDRQTVAVDNPPSSAPQRQWELDTMFDISYLLHGDVLTRQASQVNFVSEFVSMVQVALTMALPEFTMDNRAVYFIVENDDALHQSMEGSMALRFDALRAEYSSFDGSV